MNNRLLAQIMGIPAILLILSGCSMWSGINTDELGYNTAQAWQRNQCQQMVDQTLRQQCLDKLNMSYDQYKKAQ